MIPGELPRLGDEARVGISDGAAEVAPHDRVDEVADPLSPIIAS
jgi:hypothetical protein